MKHNQLQQAIQVINTPVVENNDNTTQINIQMTVNKDYESSSSSTDMIDGNDTVNINANSHNDD